VEEESQLRNTTNIVQLKNMRPYHSTAPMTLMVVGAVFVSMEKNNEQISHGDE
jgi:hypothetical protein